MSEITLHVGRKIRMYRKARHMTLQELADRIHKSRASVSKYENGEISIDIETLYELARVLEIGPGQLMDMDPPAPEASEAIPVSNNRSPFFQAKRMYFYFYDGRLRRVKDGIIDIRESAKEPGSYEATFTISATTPTGRSSEIYYTGKVTYSDMLIRFSFVNCYNTLEEDLLYIFNPMDTRDTTNGLLCGISTSDLMPCAFRCLVTLTPQEHTEEFKKQLLITKKELQKWQRLNMLMVDNRSI